SPVQDAPRVASGNAAVHHQYAVVFTLGNEVALGVRPGGACFAKFHAEAEDALYVFGGSLGRRPGRRRPDETQWVTTRDAGEVAVPVLSRLARVDGVQEIGAGSGKRGPTYRAEVR